MNIRLVRKKIKSVINVKKITRAMQLVSAVKMKKAQQKAIEARPYQQYLEKIINKIVGKIDISLSPYLTTPDSERHLAVTVSTNKGLCGGFNFNLYRFLVKEIDFKKTDFVVVGKKGSLFTHRMGGQILADFSSQMYDEAASAVKTLIVSQFLDGRYQSVFIFYNQFISALNYLPTKEMLLPIIYKEAKVTGQILEDYLIEPTPSRIINLLFESLVEEKLRKALIQSEAAEHAARMMAMKNATENATDVIYNLTLTGNKLRQEKITAELLDMLTAKESVELE